MNKLFQQNNPNSILQIKTTPNPETGEIEKYTTKEGDIIAYLGKEDCFGQRELIITDFGIERKFLSYNNKLLDRNTGEII